MKDRGAEESLYLRQKGGVGIIAPCHLVGHKAGHAQTAKLVQHGGLAAAYASRQSHKQWTVGSRG